MKCGTCKDRLWCDSCCNNLFYRPSVIKLLKRKFVKTLLRKFGLDEEEGAKTYE